MKALLLTGMLLLSATRAFAGGSPVLSGDYVIANKNDCPYLAEISGNRPGGVINITAGSTSFDVNLKFVCGPNDLCPVGEVALQPLANEPAGHTVTGGEGGTVIFDGIYSDDGRHFVSTVSDLGLPEQQQEGVGGQANVVFEATKLSAGIRLVFNRTTTCVLANSK